MFNPINCLAIAWLALIATAIFFLVTAPGCGTVEQCALAQLLADG